MQRLLLILIAAGSIYARRVPGRYIVELETPSVAEKLGSQLKREGPRGARANAQRTAVRAEQQRARNRLTTDAVVLETVDTVANAMFVQIDDAQASHLLTLPGVKSVRQMRTFHMVLDRAVQVHRVPDVWNQVGFGNAGIGVKIGIIDSGIDVQHPGFQDSSLPIPDSFPKMNSASDQAYTNNKVIVARSYVNLLSSQRDPDKSARDRVGHGTALGMVAAGVQNNGPLAGITGVAPKAYLGNYKVFGTPGYNDGATDAAIIKAIDDAVNDGMDVISLSLGADMAPRLSEDPEVQAVERAFKAGVIVVVAAGNSGNDLNTMASPGTAPSAITVGASRNGRTFAASAQVAGGATYIAIPGSAATAASDVSASVADVAALDGNGLACSSLPSGSLSARIALIQRGTCTFESKLNNARAAGAIGALVFAAADAPDPFVMSMGTATLPAEMVAYADGVAAKDQITRGGLTVTLHFAVGPVDMDPNRVTTFSGAGPNVDASIKPDLVAVGQDVYTATQSFDRNGDMYDASGYIIVDGTSFSTPLVAGAAALIKSARPGLTADQYRSLIINAASAVGGGVQRSGAGVLNAWNSLQTTATAYPTALHFGSGSGGASPADRNIKLTNVSGTVDTYSVEVVSGDGGAAPGVAANTLQLGPGESADLAVSWNGATLAGGAHEGWLRITSATTGTETRVPYWYAVASNIPAKVTILDSITTGRRSTLSQDAILFRVTDSAGLPITTIKPDVQVAAGGGSVRSISSYDNEVPGLFGVSLRLGATAGANTFRIQAGDATADVTITGQ